MLSNANPTRRFVREALPLISSYLYSEDVTLEPTYVDVANESSDEYTEFSRVLRMRHAVECGLKLKPILGLVERGFSHVSETVRAESKGNISGRLDIQLYLNRRMSNFSWPRNYPVLVAEDTPDTSENQLIAESLREVGRRLKPTRVTSKSTPCTSIFT